FSRDWSSDVCSSDLYYVNGMPKLIDEKHLPITLPEVEKYLPTETGEPPLGNATVWAWDTQTNAVVENHKIDHKTVFPLEMNTMPVWAGSSQYFNRYMDPHNDDEIFSQEAINYWKQVDLYIGGSEHATGHLLYARFWQKFMFDKGLVPVDEFAKKLINQGMILGTSAFVLVLLLQSRVVLSINNNEEDKEKIKKAAKSPKALIIDKEVYDEIQLKGFNYRVDEWIKNKNSFPDDVEIYYSKGNLIKSHIDISLLKGATDEVDKERLKLWQPQFFDAEYLSDKPYVAIREPEKMSKSKYNVVNPDQICKDYGADSLRLYEMFLGPLEQYKPW